MNKLLKIGKDVEVELPDELANMIIEEYGSLNAFMESD